MKFLSFLLLLLLHFQPISSLLDLSPLAPIASALLPRPGKTVPIPLPGPISDPSSSLDGIGDANDDLSGTSDGDEDVNSSDPYGAIGNGNLGWKEIAKASALESATLLRNYSPKGDGATLPIYISNDVEPESVTRVVIVIAAHPRDSWAYFDAMKASRDLALAGGVAIMSPMFFKRQDRDAGSPSPTDLVWFGDDWASGGDSKWPASSTPISSFEVLDDLITRSFNLYPQLTNLVLAGHSMGSQAIQRHSIFSPLTSDSRVSYFISNPASYVYMDSSRPLPTNSCPNFDAYKYGLSGPLPPYISTSISSIGGKTALLDRLLGRNIHLTAGQKDFKKGDKRCQASVQGSNHRQRSRFYRNHIEDLNDGKLPDSWSWDLIRDCGHDQFCMFNSMISQRYLFGDNAKGIPALDDLLAAVGLEDDGSGSGSGTGSGNGKGTKKGEKKGNELLEDPTSSSKSTPEHKPNSSSRKPKSIATKSSPKEDSSILLRSSDHNNKQRPFNLGSNFKDLLFGGKQKRENESSRSGSHYRRDRLLSSTRR